MLYKFKSRAAADLIMLEPQGKQVVTIMGKTPGASGIVTVAQIPAAIAALEAAVAAEDKLPASADTTDQDDDAKAEESVEAVRLRQRVAPLIDMLKRSAAEGADVVWGA